MSIPDARANRIRAALRIGGSVLILALLFRFLPARELLGAMRRVPGPLWLVVVFGYLATHVLGVVKWRVMVNLAGARLRIAQAARCYFAGLFGTLFLPSIVGGDLVRIGLAFRLARNRPGVLLGNLLDRMLDVLALAGIAAFGAFLLPGALDGRNRKLLWTVAAVVVLLALSLAALLAVLPCRQFSYKMRRRLVKLRQAGRSFLRQPQYTLLALGLGVAVQTSLVVLTATLGEACGLFVPLSVWLLAWPLAKLSALLPITQGGIGVRELALAALLAPFGAPAVLTVAVGLVWESVIIGGGLLAGLLSFLVGRFSAAMPEPPSATAAAPGERLMMPRP